MTSHQPEGAGEKLLQIRDLHVSFVHHRGEVRVVRGVTIDVAPGQVVGLVGESGSGKSITCKSVLSLLPSGAHVRKGEIWLEGRNVVAAGKKEQARTRGRLVGLIPQDPLSSLNPVLKIGTQIDETIRLHRGLSKDDARQVSLDLLRSVQISKPELVVRQYPHQLSGGMRQRIASVIALSAQPRLLIADEPTTSLDVTIQHEFIQLLKELQRQRGFGMVFVTHDLALISSLADYLYVMREGLVVEEGTAEAVFRNPQHEYTHMLLDAAPRIDGPILHVPEGG